MNNRPWQGGYTSVSGDRRFNRRDPNSGGHFLTTLCTIMVNGPVT